MLVASFPSLYTIGEWLGLDLREFAFWLRMAHVQKLSDQLRAMEAGRVAQAEGKDYKHAANRTERQIRDLLTGVTKQDRQSDDWEMLGKIGKG